MRTMTAARRWAVLVTVGAGLLLITLDNSILYTALPTLTEELDTTSSESLWIINAYPLVMAGLLLGTGTLGDRVGHTRMFVLGLVIFGVASLVAAFSPNPEVLIAARAVLAVGAASMMPATLALVRTTFTIERERNLAIAVWGSLAIVGSALGPIIGGLLLTHFWWGSVFLVNVPVVVLALVATVVIAPANDPDPQAHWDLLSSLQAMAGLAGLVFAIKEVAKIDGHWQVVVVALAVSVIGFVLFVRRQHRMSHPLLDFAIFRNPAFMSGVMAAGFSMFAIGGIQLVTTQRFQLVADFSPLQAGLLVAAVAVGSLPTALFGGAFLHRTGLLPLITGGLGVATAGVLIAVWGFDHGLGWLIAGLAVTGAGLGAAMSVASTAIVGNVPARRAGMASSVEEVSYEFGSLTAVALLGSLITAVYASSIRLPEGAPAQAREGIEQAFSAADPGASGEALRAAASMAYDDGYTIVLLVAAAVLAVGAVATGWLLRHHGPGTSAVIDGADHH
jgi:MFS transporter, DHA2 family, multidrug resistance protein